MKKFIPFLLFFSLYFTTAWAQEGVSGSTRFFMTTQGPDGIFVYKGSYNEAPQQIPSTAGLGFRDLAIVGNTIYLTTQGPDGIWKYVIDSGEPPRQIPGTAGLGFRSIIAAGDSFFYLTTQGPDGIYTYDLNSNQPPKQIPSSAGLGFLGIHKDMLDVYLTTQGLDGLFKIEIDTDDIQRPKQLQGTAKIGFRSMVLNYLTAQGPHGLFRYDAANNKVVQVEHTAGYSFRDVIHIQDALFLTTEGGGGIYEYVFGSTPTQLAHTNGFGFRSLAVYQK